MYRLQKFFKKNRGPVTAAVVVVVVLVLGFVVSTSLYFVADHALTDKNVALNEVLRLADVKRLEDRLAEAEELWPCVPTKVEPMEKWLEKARELLSRLPIHEDTLESLRKVALPYDEAATATDRRTHPRATELAELIERRDKAVSEAAEIDKEFADGKATLIAYGDDVKERPITVYFRRTFEVTDPNRRNVFAPPGPQLLEPVPPSTETAGGDTRSG